ncbi:MAG: hypothetical protein M3P27_06845 [Acidobacteriota bacterium]|nr:hypothetical protein [Acidobacteriota bacterium]
MRPRPSLPWAISALVLTFFAGAPAAQTLGPQAVPPAAQGAPPKIVAGQVMDRVGTLSDPAQSYPLYLPSAYTPKRQWPVIFAFDPAARGKVPVELFREAAEKYGYIVAGSNDSRNGPRREQTTAATAMMADVQQRFPLDPARVYAAGFSGGARMAGLAGFLCHDCIRAVIACGAGLPDGLSPEQRKHLPAFFFTVGKYDFNYFDVLDAARSLPIARVAIFEGAHQWAPPELAMQAVAWLDAGARDAGVPPLTALETAERKRQSDLTRHLSLLLNTAETETEDREQDLSDARRDVAALRAKRLHATAGEDLAVLRRALGQVFAQTYETSQRLARANKPELAAAFLEVAAAAVAPDPTLAYEVASAWAAAKDKGRALESLRRAVELGFHDRQHVDADKNFDRLRAASEFRAIVATMR